MKTFLIIFVLTNATLILAQEFDVAQKPQQTRIGVGIMLTEIFKPIKNYEGRYEISNFGEVKSLAKGWNTCNGGVRKRPDTILKPAPDERGYLMVNLYTNGKNRTMKIHRLVWDAFGDKPRESHKLQIDHIDNNKSNNHINNLQLLSCRENISKSCLISKRSGLPIGVYWEERTKKYRVEIRADRKRLRLGRFTTIDEASNAYQEKLKTINNC